MNQITFNELYPDLPFYGPKFLEGNHTPIDLEHLRKEFPMRYKIAIDPEFALKWEQTMHREAINVVEHLEDVAMSQAETIRRQDIEGQRYVG